MILTSDYFTAWGSKHAVRISNGMPEAQLTLAHSVIYSATCKKSRAVANALEKAREAVLSNPNEPIPLHLRNAPTKLMKELGYAKGYKLSLRSSASPAGLQMVRKIRRPHPGPKFPSREA